jgi:hypothetical protein
VQETGALASEQDAAMRLLAVLRRAPLVMEALRAARAVDALDWPDARAGPGRRRRLARASASPPVAGQEPSGRASLVPTHLRHRRITVSVLRRGGRDVSETATCVGVRLLADDDMLVVAPHGLDDLFGCVCRHNPTRVSAGFYERRVAEKGWPLRWPQMRYVPPNVRSARSP